MEILAPAGGQEQLYAAVRSGANAVYLGLKTMSARAGAANFSPAELCDAVSYCKVRGVRVYAAVNTLLKNSELESAAENIRVCAGAGVDGVLIQDPAMIGLMKSICPSMPIHASTQMTIHNVAGAKACERLGFSRIVLARELSLKEIRAIAGAVACEIEVFVHGAMCMSVSGACLMSSMLGGRSGNRGRCAQPCRLDFVNAHGRHYALSLKDMSYLSHARELAEAGVDSLKIEGRLKRPEYVAAAVNAAACALRGEEYDENTLKNVFSRSGFSDGYLTNRRNTDMFGARTAEDAAAAAAAFPRLHELYKNEYRGVRVDVGFSADREGNIRADFCDGENTVTVERRIPTGAEADAVRRITDSLCKSGGTPYAVSVKTVDIPEGFNPPASAVNAIRRDGLAALSEARGKIVPYEIRPYTPPGKPEIKNTVRPDRLIPRYESASQASGSGQAIFPLNEILRNPALTDRFEIIAELPRFVFPSYEERATADIGKLAGLGVDTVIADGPGGFLTAKESGLNVISGIGANLMNRDAVAFAAAQGASGAILSPEINARDIPGLNADIPVGIIAYGYLPLMSFRACPVMGKNGCGNCDGRQILTDRTGARFTVLCRDRRYQQLLNSVPLYVCDQEFRGADFGILYFTTETRAECEKIISLSENRAPFPGRRTNGLYKREVL
ncbi:MAG: U32 family peptidase [Clostridia bacterium]|nr:U32 family peptidase [Clostridia bacterium]